MDDFQLVSFLVMVVVAHLSALLVPIGLAAAAVLSAAPLKFEPITV